MTAYASLTGEIAPHVTGCPSAVIEAYVRKVVIDLCNRAHVWRVRLDNIPLVAGTYQYALASPVATTEVITLLSGAVLYASNNNIKPLAITTDDEARATYPNWPDVTNLAPPVGVIRYNATSLYTVPVPDAQDTYTIVNLFAAIRPTQASTGWDDNLFEEFRREVFHGVLAELMMMPDRNWFNEKMAAYHGKQWSYLLNSARARANKGFSRAAINVQQRPWA